DGPVIARSVFPSALKSPTRIFAFVVAAQPGKFPAGELVTLKVPSPFENATGMLFQPDGPVIAASVFPSPLKSPTRIFAFVVAAQPGKFPAVALVTLKVPSPFENATGKLFQPEGPVKAT